MFILAEARPLEIARDLNELLSGRPDVGLDEIAATLCRHSRPELVADIVHSALDAVADRIDEAILFRGGLVRLVDSPLYSLDLRYAFEVRGEDMLPSGQNYNLLARASDMVIANIGPKVLRGAGYSIRDSIDFDRFDPLARLDFDGYWELQAGQARLIRGGEQIASVLDASGVRFLSLALPPRWSLDWLFSRETMRPVARSVAHVDDSQFVTCLELASWLRDDLATDKVRMLTEHRAHFVRWKAIQALALLRPSEALPLVEKAAAEDSHPSVRKAAGATLALRGAADLDRPQS
ncbi:hypothetical protein GCM10009087_31020 [Sphingomonas oligophenolica]|uniref:HEAT repeat domain-containing protein n=1 Tax=Sphingomonas oligophenolica TaxID=301154 RepID=A0ABU9Y6N6_9SPHN